MRYFRGAIDQFFFTVVYAVVVYMVGLASFKLIDQIPSNILRWMGKSVTAYANFGGGDAASMFQGNMVQSQQMAGQLKAAGEGAGQAVSEGAAGIKEALSKKPTSS